MKSTLRGGAAALLSLLMITLCVGCGSAAPQAGTPAAGGTDRPESAAAYEPEPENTGAVRERPECRLSAYHADQAEPMEGVDGSIDCSALSQGYVAASVRDESRLKFRVIRGEETYTYDLPGDGTPAVFPLNMGDGSYTFELLRGVSTKYARVWTDTREVVLEDEFAPWLVPSHMVNYSADSACVERAWELTKGCASDVDIAGAVYRYLAEELSYDDAKAERAKTSYFIPDPDATLAEKKGICFDYAALAAAMLRSQGIPCQLITGYVGEQELYHAWNRFYVKNQGWITAEIQARGNDWKRVDITFASVGYSARELEDEGAYTTRYTY